MTHPARDDLALAALPAEPRNAAVEAHLTGCGACRDHVDGLRRTVELARDGVVEDGPPTRVWEAIAAEIREQAPPAKVGRTGSPTVAPSRWLVAAAAAAAGLLVGVTGGLGISAVRQAPAPSRPVVVARLAPVGTADPGGSGTVAMRAAGRDNLMLVDLTGVADLRGGDFLEVWLMDPTGGRLLALGTLERDGAAWHGVFAVPTGQPTAPYTVVDVSAERFDGDPGHSHVSLLRGRLA